MHLMIQYRAKILLKASLLLNERDRADLRLLENTKVTLQTYSKIDDITTSKIFENVALTDTLDYIVEF